MGTNKNIEGFINFDLLRQSGVLVARKKLLDALVAR